MNLRRNDLIRKVHIKRTLHVPSITTDVCVCLAHNNHHSHTSAMAYRRISSSLSSCLDSVEAIFDTDLMGSTSSMAMDASDYDGGEEFVRDGGCEGAIFLVGNHLGDKGVARIVDGLQDPCREYYKLYLCDNRIGHVGASILSYSLKYNTTLMELSVGNNHIGDDGAIHLASALSVNNTLQMLNLENNDIGHRGTTALATVLENRNNSLQWLVLSENPIGDEGANAILQCIGNTSSFEHLQRCNHSLLSIVLKKCEVADTTTTLRKIKCFLKINRSSVRTSPKKAAQLKILMHVKENPKNLLDYFAKRDDVSMEMQCIVQILALLGYQDDLSTSFVIMKSSPHILFSKGLFSNCQTLQK